MSTSIQKLEPVQIKPSASPQGTAIASLIPKQLPDSIINRISSFTSYDELLHTIRPVRKICQQLPIHGILNLNNSLITDKELIEIIDKEQELLTHVKLSNCPNITDLSLKHLAKLQNLATLDLSSCHKITDAGVKELSKLQNLRTLDLGNCEKITDAGIKDLSKLQNLRTLNLKWCYKITDAGVKDLAKLQNLKTLNLSWCDKITDLGAKDLSKLPNLTTLNLRWCIEITDAGVKELSKLQNLTTLDLSWCDKITDEGAKDLSKMQNLTGFYLCKCKKITDAGVKELSKLQNLTTLDLSECNKITDAVVEDLLKLPNLIKLELRGVVEELNLIRQLIAEKTVIKEFLNEKSQKIRILNCEPKFNDDEAEMSCSPLLGGYQININFLYLLTEKHIDSFLLQKPDVQKSVQTFLIQKKPELIEKAATDLIEWFNSNKVYKVVAARGYNKVLAKVILIMHAIGKLSAMKRFILTHEMGHAHEHDGRKSLGDFGPLKLDFIMPHQFPEVRADLTAAREENAHELGIAYFEWRSIIAGEHDGLGLHPTDRNRAKAIKIDRDKILKGTTSSLSIAQALYQNSWNIGEFAKNAVSGFFDSEFIFI